MNMYVMNAYHSIHMRFDHNCEDGRLSKQRKAKFEEMVSLEILLQQ